MQDSKALSARNLAIIHTIYSKPRWAISILIDVFRGRILVDFKLRGMPFNAESGTSYGARFRQRRTDLALAAQFGHEVHQAFLWLFLLIFFVQLIDDVFSCGRLGLSWIGGLLPALVLRYLLSHLCRR